MNHQFLAGKDPPTGNPVGALHLPHIPFPKLAQQALQLLVDVMELGRFRNRTDWGWINLRNLRGCFTTLPAGLTVGGFLTATSGLYFGNPGYPLSGSAAQPLRIRINYPVKTLLQAMAYLLNSVKKECGGNRKFLDERSTSESRIDQPFDRSSPLPLLGEGQGEG